MSFDRRMLLHGHYNPLAVEKTVGEWWEREEVYRRVKERVWSGREGAPIFAFLEGPPTTNGFMHVGHARGRTFKDVKLRWARMRGFRVWDQAGWDTQGLPVELEVEKKLGLRSKKDIERFGVERFVEECRRLVDYYLEHWVRASKRLGLWLDYEHAYETRHPRYIEVVWSFIKKAHEEGLLYEGLRVVPRCPRCQTALSQHEVALGYKEVDDPSVYFKLPLEGFERRYLVAWTTTPWTIVANELAAVHPEEEYVVIRVGGEEWVLAEKLLEQFAKTVGLEKYEVVEKLKGSQLEGLRYRHPLAEEVPYHAKHEPPYHTVRVAEWVTMEEGTGVVHVAPAHGPEDFELARSVGVEPLTPLKPDGYFGDDAGVFAGLWFEEAGSKVIEVLRGKGLLIHAGTVRHSYPFCWRCDTRLIYLASKQWFIRLPEELKRRMAAEVESTRWAPPWAMKRMSDWVVNARDWCISRERYWGTPLPVWTCPRCGYREVIGSIEELRGKAVNPEELRDVHRPWIDRVKLRCPKCGAEMVREPFVVDVWMDSGVAHTASLHQYGWDDLLPILYPYTWITEAADQTRGWFYTLLVTGTIMHGRCPYRSVLLQGHVLDKHGKKMSKSRGNVVWAYEFMEKHGADPMRIFLLTRAPWDSINFDPEEVERTRSQLNTFWNVVRFASTYMDLDGFKPSGRVDAAQARPEDLWVIYEAARAAEEISRHIESDDYHHAVRRLLDLLVEKLSHRYVTVVRPRVWEEGDTPSKRAAYETMYYVLRRAIAMLAPFAPYLAEYLHQTFTLHYGSGEFTVHLEAWPSFDAELLDEETWRVVDAMFRAAEEVLRLRTEAKIKRRWPLRKAIVVAPRELVGKARDAAHVLAIYANIKEVEVVGEGEASVPSDWSVVDADPLKVYVRVALDEETLLEGLAREVVRRVQVMRKQANLPLDEILEAVEVYTTSEKLRRAVEVHREYIAREVRAREVRLTSEPPEDGRRWSIEGEEAVIAIRRSSGG